MKTPAPILPLELSGVRYETGGLRLIDELNRMGRRLGLPLHAQGIGAIFATVFTDSPPIRDYRDYKQSDERLRLAFVEGLQHRGIRTTARGTWFLSTALSDRDVAETLEAAEAVLLDLRESYRDSAE